LKYWEIIADKLHVAGWSWGYCRAVTRHGWRWIVDADREGGRRHIVQSDELLTAFHQLEAMFFGGNYPRIVLRKHLGGRHRICFQ
jgi:hypothetical protein